MALEMRGKCEKCTAPLGWDAGAFICSYGRTFCPHRTTAMAQLRPNRGGELLARPRRGENGRLVHTLEKRRK